MNKTDLVNVVAEKAGLSKKAAEQTIGVVFDAITEGLIKEGKVQLVGFGSFEVKQRSARMGRNPKTKEPIQIPASKAPVFKPGKALKDSVGE